MEKPFRDFRKAYKIYLIFITGFGYLFLTFIAFYLFDKSIPPSRILLFLILSIIADSFPVVTPFGAVTIEYSIILTAIIAIGGLNAALIQVPAVLVGNLIARKSPVYKAFFNSAQQSFCTLVAGLIYQFTGGVVGSLEFNKFVLPIILCALSYFTLNTSIVLRAFSIREGKSFWSIWKGEVKWLINNYMAFMMLGLVLAYIYLKLSIWVLLFLFFFLIFFRRLFKESMITRKIYLDTITGLAAEVEAFDLYTHGHSKRVAEYSFKIGKALQLSEEELEHLQYACLLHDIGKISISEDIINKPGKLTEEEYQLVKQHVKVGANIIQQLEFLEEISPAVRYHHERLDGKGYLEGVKRADLPILARIIAVADGFDAMTSARPYRGPLSKKEAMAELKRCVNSQYDPEIVETLVRIIENEKPY